MINHLGSKSSFVRQVGAAIRVLLLETHHLPLTSRPYLAFPWAFTLIGGVRIDFSTDREIDPCHGAPNNGTEIVYGRTVFHRRKYIIRSI